MSEINAVEKVKAVEDYVVAVRRYFHENPELSGQEFKTQEKIIQELNEMGIPNVKAGSASVIGTLVGGKPGKTVALRGDIDALPIIENSGEVFTSKNPGVMHACGHDAHAAMLLGAAKVLSKMKDDIPGEIRFFFQEGEETFSGAKKIIAAGGMDGVDAVFGMHGMPSMNVGSANIEPGYRMAGCDTIYVKFEGVSGHGSAPHKAKDTITPACQFVNNLQGIVTKNNDSQDPLVLSVGKFVGGTKANIIAKFTELDITMRYFTPESRKIAHDGIYRHAKAIGEAWEVKVDVTIEESALSLYNDPELTELANQVFAKIAGEGKTVKQPKLMGSEDMPFYFQKAPGVFPLLGYENKEKGSIYYPHHEKFKIDEDYMKYGTAMHVQFAWDFLNK